MTVADLFITNGIVLTMDPQRPMIDNGAVAITGDTITAVDSAASLGTLAARETIDAAGGIIMPGLVNTHTHAAMTLFRGLADDLPLMTWLNDHIFPGRGAPGSGQGPCRQPSGVRRNDPLRHDLLLRHVPVRGDRVARAASDGRDACRGGGGAL